ncbi:Zn(II)2Cys6 transcription factor domain-containing protein [Aspergillus undulatus]|uniref:Zn(II)2Cys6 transcription factor domain-containing protein n=1 Tax=Aspergillus undulatus TaxID=1810928 RepID=UPI003CCD68BB
MLRRSHKKSYGGCFQCKKRHVKCDQHRPICLLCTMSGRDRECSYASQGRVASRTGGRGEGASAPVAASSSSSHSASPFPSLPPPQTVTLQPEEPINLQHIELITHLITDSTLIGLGDGLEPYHVSISRALETGLSAPYLLYALLAFSARRLQYLHRGSKSGREGVYAQQATALQTRAIALFNSERVAVDSGNCVAVCLFSVVLGHHLLTDTLGQRGRAQDGLDAFLKRYSLCLETLRGVFTIAMTGWPLLLESYLAPALSRSRQFTSSDPKGTECNLLKALITGSDGLHHDAREACLRAIKYLQLGFDALSNPLDGNMRYQMLFLWSVLVPPEFTRILAAKRPEALVILAYYALLLCYGQHIWQVEEAGVYIFGIVDGYLGSEWDEWLEFARRAIYKLQPEHSFQ